MRLIIDLFIIAYLFVAWAWRQPAGTFGRVATEPLITFLRWSGFGQDWSMFTPDPPVAGADVEIIIKRASGSAIRWQLPRMIALSRWGAFRNFRYRTYANAILSNWAAATVRPAVADYVLRKYEYGDDHPIEILYTWIAQPVAPPGDTAAAAPTQSVFHSVAVPDTTA